MDGSKKLGRLVGVSRALRATAARLKKRQRMVSLFRALSPADLRLAACYLAGEIPQGALRVGWRTLDEATRVETSGSLPLFAGLDASPSPLTLEQVDTAFGKLAGIEGSGAQRRRIEVLGALLARAEEEERDFLRRLLLGELRQGALRALVEEALAVALDVSLEDLRRGIMVSGAFDRVVMAVAEHGPSALRRFGLKPLVPVQLMLASTASSLEEALAGLEEAAVEWKLDGIRVQLHRRGEDVRIFSRRLRDITAQLPGVVEMARKLKVESCILDGEVIALGTEGRPLPFQELMSLLSRESGASSPQRVSASRILPLFFDLLQLDGVSFVEHPYQVRRDQLEAILDSSRCVPRTLVRRAQEGRAFLESALAAGHEGVVVKRIDAPYLAGRRGSGWLKVKPAATVDLVILAAEWGHGRRQGLLSNLHLGARDPTAPGRFLMLGKTFKGLTDAMLAELTADLPRIETRREGNVVHVEPRRVVEIAFDGLQRSARYDSGLALRFARVRRLRPDKNAETATSIEEVRALHRERAGRTEGGHAIEGRRRRT